MLNNFDVFWDTEHLVFQVRTKTDVYAIEFDNDQKNELFQKMVDLHLKNPKIRMKRLISNFSAEQERTVLEILVELKDYGLLTEDYYIDLGIENKEIYDLKDQAEHKKVLLIGLEDITLPLERVFKENKFKNTKTLSIEEQLPEDFSVKYSEYDFFIVDGNNWNPVFLKQLNSIFIEMNKPWLYVKGLEGADIKVGPIFLGGELGCYDCLQSRIRSNHQLDSYNQMYEKYLKEKGLTAKHDNFPTYQSSIEILVNIVFQEASKYLQQWAVPETIGAYLSFNIISYQSSIHKLLKIPYCESCKPKVEYNISPWLEAVTLS